MSGTSDDLFPAHSRGFWYDYFATMREAGDDLADRKRAFDELIATWAILDRDKREKEAQDNEQRVDSI